MSANEKHAATYHGGQYTPDVDDLRDLWVDRKLDPLPRAQGIELVPTVQAEFDRWLEQIRAEAKAEAYKDAERILHEEARWQLDLHQRHKEYRFKHCSERMTEMENCMTVRANQYIKDTP